MIQYTNSKPEGNALFHVTLNPPTANVILPFDPNVLAYFLQTDRPGGEALELGNGTGYFFAWDNNLHPPYPSVMVMKWVQDGDVRVLQDVSREDLPVIRYARETYLKPPAETAANPNPAAPA